MDLKVKKSKEKFLSSRKGMDIDLWFNTFELLLVFLVGVILADMINGEANDSTFEKNYFARDNALLLNTIYASPGDITYQYPEDTKNFIVEVKPNKIDVYEHYELQEGGVMSYPFAEDKIYSLSYRKLLPDKSKEKKLEYKKDKNAIEVNK